MTVPTLSAHGATIPVIGLGTSGMGDVRAESIATALKLGYRHIDTAWKYGTERQVGEGMRASGVPRADIFLCTKVSHEYLHADDLRTSLCTRGSVRVTSAGKDGLMKQLGFLAVLAIASVSVTAQSEPLIPQIAQPYSADLLGLVRRAATAIPGAQPSGINYIKVAESHRPLSEIIEGGSQERYVSARTAFQVTYPSGSVMIDAGMDQAVHKFFGFGREEPYWPDRNAAVQEALKKANLILVTHEHGDHIAGVVRSDARKELAAKTMLTSEQVRTLTLYPQMPEIRLTPEAARDYIVVDYESHLPVAPGIVLIKAAGHTPGHQMVYVRLESGREHLFIGDVAWTLANVTQFKLRPAATMRRISEDAQALTYQLRWIKDTMEQEKLLVIPSHDDVLLQDLAAKRLIGEGLR